jgi:hypothetical protein
MVRASGGVIFYSNAQPESGVQLGPGSGGWQSVSDVNRKHAFRPLDGEQVLHRIAALQIQEWSYRSQDLSSRHVGPTAQDFRAAFGLGEDSVTINTVDIDGINLLGVQALERRTADQAAELRAQVERLGAQAGELEALRQENAGLRALLLVMARRRWQVLQTADFRAALIDAQTRLAPALPAGAAADELRAALNSLVNNLDGTGREAGCRLAHVAVAALERQPDLPETLPDRAALRLVLDLISAALAGPRG